MLIDRNVAVNLVRTKTQSKDELERTASRLVRLANELPTDIQPFAEALLAEFVLWKRFSYRRASQPCAGKVRIAAWFDIHPFKLGGVQGQEEFSGKGASLDIDDRQALLPLYFRDALSNTFLRPVTVGSITFGCMRVDYFVDKDTDLTVLHVGDVADVADQFNLTKLEIQGEPFYQAA